MASSLTNDSLTLSDVELTSGDSGTIEVTPEDGYAHLIIGMGGSGSTGYGTSGTSYSMPNMLVGQQFTITAYRSSSGTKTCYLPASGTYWLTRWYNRYNSGTTYAIGEYGTYSGGSTFGGGSSNFGTLDVFTVTRIS